MNTSSFRTVFAGVLVAVVGMLLGTVFATPALAHVSLKGSTPEKNAKVESLEQVELEFTQPVRLPTVILRGPDGETYHSGKPKVDERFVRQDVADDLPAGKYTIAFRVVSPDGHPVEGEIPFTLVATEPTESPAAAEGDAASPEATADEASGGEPAATDPATAPSDEPAAAAADGTGQDAAPASGEEASGGVPAWVWVVIFGLAGVGIGLAISLRPKKTGDTEAGAKPAGDK